MKTWDQFYPYILRFAPGVPMPTIDFELREAAREFCERTLCWRDTLTAVTTDGTNRVFTFSAAATQDVVSLLSATLDGDPIQVIRQGDAPVDWRVTDSIGPVIFALTTGSQFAVIPLQSAGLDVVTEVALRPSLSATGVQDDIFEAYARPIAWGALANLKAGSEYRGMFNDAIAYAATEVLHSFSPAPARVRASFL